MEAAGHLLSRHQFLLSLAPLISSHLIPRARYAHSNYTRNGVSVQAWHLQASSPDSGKAIWTLLFQMFFFSLRFEFCHMLMDGCCWI